MYEIRSVDDILLKMDNKNLEIAGYISEKNKTLINAIPNISSMEIEYMLHKMRAKNEKKIL